MHPLKDQPRQTGGEGAVWQFFHDLLRYPTVEQWNWLQSEAVHAALGLLSDRLELSGTASLSYPSDYEEYETEFVRTFEVGTPYPLCPLIESHWNKKEPVSKILHENTLFYRQFGLQLKIQGGENADHLRHQLEFLSYLYQLEIRMMQQSQPDSIEMIELARRDFVQRHLPWIDSALAALENSTETPEWIVHWMKLLVRAVHSTSEWNHFQR
ncbi:MAG: molecular chaperone TorD family protein [bacterium]|jgi:DMSO reductase family type II enzyme chaperone